MSCLPDLRDVVLQVSFVTSSSFRLRVGVIWHRARRRSCLWWPPDWSSTRDRKVDLVVEKAGGPPKAIVSCLVVWNRNFMTFWWFGTWWFVIIPTDEFIFFRGVQTTNQLGTWWLFSDKAILMGCCWLWIWAPKMPRKLVGFGLGFGWRWGIYTTTDVFVFCWERINQWILSIDPIFSQSDQDEFNRRKFRSQTSDNMDRWKAEQGRGREKRKIRRDKSRRERVRCAKR